MQAIRVRREMGVEIPVIGLAKRLEEVFGPGDPEPIVLPRASEALFLLQHLRDEAHRTAVGFHRRKRAKRSLASPLDDIPGVGPARKKALLKAFGSLAKLRSAEQGEIAEVPGIGPELAGVIYAGLHREGR